MYASYSSYHSEVNKQINTDMLGVIDLRDKNHKDEVVSKNRIVCIEIYADWCGPCKTLSPTYATMALEFRDKYSALLVKYNYSKMASDERTVCQVVPMFEFYLDGKRLDETVIGGDLRKVEEIISKMYSQLSNQFSNSSFSKNAIRNFKPT